MLSVGAVILSVALQTGQDPAEMLAIAYTESRWQQFATGPSGSVGPLQINCRAWWRHLKFESKTECQDALIKSVELNATVSTYILARYRNRYKQCSGENVYACYNGGPGWRTLSERAQRRAQHYQRQVIERARVIRPLLQQPVTEIWKALQSHERAPPSASALP